MKLDKNTRHRLFAGQTVELPLSKLGNVRQDGVYAIHTQKGTRQGQLRVLLLRGERAVVRYEGDPVRLLARDGDYTDFEGRALPREPEAVDEETQNEFSKAAEKRAAKRDKEAKLERERLSLEARIGLARKVAEVRQIDVSPKIRVIENQLRAIERQLDGFERDAA